MRINFLTNLPKIAEAIILDTLRELVCEGNLLPNKQLQLVRLPYEVRNALELRQSTGAVFLDHAHGFDSV